MDRSGEVIAADGSTEGASPLCCSLWRADEAGSIKAGLGMVWRCRARYDKLRRGDSCRRQHGEFRFSLLLSLKSR